MAIKGAITFVELVAKLTRGFIKETGKQPDSLAKIKISMEAAEQIKNQSKVVDFPKDRITPFYKPRPGAGVDNTKQRILKIDDELDNLSTKEGKYGNMNRNDRDDLMIKLQDESSTLQEPKGKINYSVIEEKFGFPLQGNESLSELAKIEKMGRDEYYNSLANRAMSIRTRMARSDAEGGTEIAYQEFNKLQKELDGLNEFITRVQKEIPEGMASGGLAREGMAGGGLLRKFLLNKKTVRKAVDDIFPTGDYKYDAEMAAEALVENNPKFFKNKLYDDLSDTDRMEVYGSVLSEVQNDLAKMLEARRLSKPTKTLEGLKKEGTIDISNPEVADEFTRFMKESDPKGYKDLEQKVDLSNLDIKGKKGHASGGIARAGMFGGKLALDALRKLITKKYTGKIDDSLLKRMLADDNPQRISEVMATIDEAMIMQSKGMKNDAIMDTFKESWKRQKNASGGIAGQLHLNRPGYASGTKKKKKEEAIINPNYVPSTLEEMINAIDIKPRAKGSFTEGPYGPKNEQRTWSDVIGGEATVDLPWGFELKGDYDKFRIKDRLYSSDDEYLDERVGADHDRWKLELLWKKKFGKGAKKLNQGGRAGSGLNYLLGEDDQNVRMPSGGLPGLLGE